MTTINRPLTKMQTDFCQNYIKMGFNAYQAAIAAGYTHGHANQGVNGILTTPKSREPLIKAVEKANQSIVEKLGITFEWRAERLKIIINAIVSHDGLRIAHAKTAIAAIAELNKMTGDYAPDKSLRLNVDMTKDRLKEVKKAYAEY